MTSETAGELRKLLNATTDAFDSLQALGDWEILIAGKTEPVLYSELKKFMQERLSTLESIPVPVSRLSSAKDLSRKRW